MKLDRIIKMCAVAALLALSASSLLAQNGGGFGGGNGGGFGGGNGGGFGGGGGRNRGGQNGGNFDPAAMMQRQLDRYQQQLNFTNDDEWAAVKPLVQKVLEAQTAARGGMFGGMGGGRRGGGQGGPGGMQQQPNPERDALQNAIDQDAPAAQIKDLLAKYRAAQKTKQAKLDAAQEDLKKVLTTPQEAQATLIGLVQ